MRPSQIHFALALTGLALLLAALACTYPGLEDTDVTQPTQAPTAAPTAAPPGSENPPASSYPLTVYKPGVKTSYGSSSDVFCDVMVAVTLTVDEDGSAELSATGPSIIDHYNCTPGSDETWVANGVANESEQSVTFQTCNYGGFGGSGTVYYGEDFLTGEVYCTWNDGSLAIALILGE